MSSKNSSGRRKPEDDSKARPGPPDSGEIEWAEGFVTTPPTPGDARVDPSEIRKSSDKRQVRAH